MLHIIADYLSIVFILTNIALLASSRLGVCVKAVSAQGIILAVIPLLHKSDHIAVSTLFVCLVTLAIKGVAFPRLLLAAVKRAGINRELDPIVGYGMSLLIGVAMLGFSFWLQTRLPLGMEKFLLPASLFGIMTGLYVTIARRTALTQIVGYLALENGIFAFGAAALPEHPWLLEMGILLDVFVGVFIMGVAIFHISREFQHIDADRLVSLRDAAGEE